MLLLLRCRLSSVPSEIFLNCVSLFTLSLHNNPITAAALREMKGFSEFDERRRGKYSKQVSLTHCIIPKHCADSLKSLHRMKAL